MVRNKGERMSRKPFQPTRRSCLQLMGGVSAMLAMPFVIRPAEAQGRRIVVRDAGGPFAVGLAKAFYEPFQQATGIEVVSVTSSAEPTSQIKSMVDTQTYSWDLASVTLAAVEQLNAEGQYFEKHGLESDDRVKQIPAEYSNEYGVGRDIYATVLAYRTDVFKTPPTSWKDFWDVEKFKGRRGLRKHPFDTVEQALFAAGADASNVYPCDLDKAFAQLDLIRSNVDAWWTGGAQSTQMLVNGEVDMMPTWSTRVTAAQAEGTPLGIIWDKNLWGVDVWSILRGTPNADLCREFISFSSDAQRQAAFTPYVTNGPTNPAAYEFIPKEIAETLPTYEPHRAAGVAIDNAYWGTNKDQAIERFNTWILG